MLPTITELTISDYYFTLSQSKKYILCSGFLEKRLTSKLGMASYYQYK